MRGSTAASKPRVKSIGSHREESKPLPHLLMIDSPIGAVVIEKILDFSSGNQGVKGDFRFADFSGDDTAQQSRAYDKNILPKY